MRAVSSPPAAGCARRRLIRSRRSDPPRATKPARVDHPDLPGPASGRSMYGTHSRRRTGGIPVRDRLSARSRAPGPATLRSAAISSSRMPGSSSMPIGSSSERSMRRNDAFVPPSARVALPASSSRRPTPLATARSTEFPVPHPQPVGGLGPESHGEHLRPDLDSRPCRRAREDDRLAQRESRQRRPGEAAEQAGALGRTDRRRADPEIGPGAEVCAERKPRFGCGGIALATRQSLEVEPDGESPARAPGPSLARPACAARAVDPRDAPTPNPGVDRVKAQQQTGRHLTVDVIERE